MSRLLCCLCARRPDMGAALSHPQEGEACDGAGVPAAPPTMADVIRERKKKAGGAGLGTLRRRIAAAARRPRDQRPDRGCEHARFIRSVVSSWRLAEVFLLCEELEAGAALRDLATQADLAREPANVLTVDLAQAYRDRWWCDVELVGAGWSIPAHRAILAARCSYFRDLLNRYPPSCCRVPLDGICSALSYEEVEACVCALYAGASATSARSGCNACNKWERSANNDGDLDIINVENSNSCRSGSMCRCAPSRRETSAILRLAPLLGFTVDSLHHDMRYLLDSGEMCDARLVFRLEGGCSSYGFHSALELPCHRVVLAARSRFFRSVMSRRSSGAVGVGLCGPGVALVAVDEQVLPRRFARALLHAAYTDQLDLTLVANHTANAPTGSANNNHGGGGSTGWPGVARSGANSTRPTSTAALDDAFQLYEIARFLEMAIVVQGCEDAIVEALNPDTLPHVLRWANAPHASHWVHRQAMRYLRDEFPTIMASAGAARLPRGAIADALASPFLQASEPQALRALLRWGTHQPQHQREPNVVWHTGHLGQGGSRRGARRREANDAALRESLASLIALVRVEHVPPDNELLSQLVRRGVVAAPVAGGPRASSADAWLARGNYRPPRCFLPYLDEIKALLEDQAVPEAEVSRVRRARYLHRIPDTLYMVAAARNNSANECAPNGGLNPSPSALESACVSPRVLGQLRARVRELRQSQPALTALALHHSDKTVVYRQIALRAVREMSLPDACAELLLTDIDTDRELAEEWESPHVERRRATDRSEPGWNDNDQPADCCRSGSSNGSLRCPSTGSLRGNLHIPIESTRGSTCRRELPSRSADTTRHRQSASECVGASSMAPGLGVGVAPLRSGRLSAAVPDVAMAPNANTHLLTNRDYFRHPLTNDYSGVVLQLDLGDGATHTPRPGSRAQRANAAAHSSRQREHSQAMSCLRTRPDDDELRAAIELSVIRAYSSFHPRAPSPSPSPAAPAQPPPPLQVPPAAAPAQPQHSSSRCRAMPSTLPHSYRHELHPMHHAGVLGRSSLSPVPLLGASVVAPPSGGRHRELRTPPPHHYSLSRVSSSDRSERSLAGGVSAGGAAASESRSPTPSPRRLTHHEYSVYRHHDYRMDNAGAGVRGPSPGGGYA